MNFKYILYLLLLTSFLLLVFLPKLFPAKKEKTLLRDTITQLVQTLNEEQIKKSTGFFPPISFIEDQGLYKSYVKLNFLGTYPHYLLRKYFSVPDSNMFISNFVSLALIETWELGTIDLPRDQLELAVNSILNFKDKNDNETDIYTFWLQKMGESKFTAMPLNLVYGIDAFMQFSEVMKVILDTLGLDDFYKKYIDYFVQMFKIYEVVFKIPSDADDTSVNMALGGKLWLHKDEMQELNNNWTKVNSHLNETIQAYLRFAYKPFASDINEAMTDPRTYYYLHEFLKLKPNDTNLTFINTWITNLEGDKENYPDVAMPVHVNNVDLSVNANSLFGLSHVVITHPDLVTDELLNLYRSVSELVVWAIENEVVLTRPDVVILYYPSVYDFYWFVARVCSLLEKYSNEIQFNELHETRKNFGKVLREVGSNQIINLARADQTSENSRIFWEDFLGSNDTTPTGEDRLFSTSLAINMLIDTWTNHSNGSIFWRDDVPSKVVETVVKAIEFLNDEILEDNFAKENAFFSASYKGNSTDFFAYPRNEFGYINGSAINSTDFDFSKVYLGVKGVVDEAVYEQWLNQSWENGKDVPKVFPGFNEQAFPYWSSPAMTYALALMGLSKFEVINN